jgi:hypothetical protein
MKEEDMIRQTVLGTLCALALGCTDNYSVLILRNVQPGENCLVSPETEIGLTRGVLDVTNPLPDGTLNQGYVLTPVVSNSTIAPVLDQGNPGNPAGHLFYVRGAETEIRPGTSRRSQEIVDRLASNGLQTRTSLLSTSIPPSGQAGLQFEVIDFEQLEIIRQAIGGDLVQVVARVVIFGVIDGSRIETLPFEYPITLCHGCLLVDKGQCTAIAEGEPLPAGGACNPLQDENLSCCQTPQGSVICPARRLQVDEGA